MKSHNLWSNSYLSDRFSIIFIAFVTLGVYYPLLFAQVCSVDDQRMLNYLMSIETFNLKSIFFLKVVYYYRPILYLTYVFDRFAWLCFESFMHLENIFIHLINGILVFLCSREISKRFEIHSFNLAPMIISLLFVLHPINTESVCWISGRSDLMAATFIYLAIYLMLKWGMSKAYAIHPYVEKQNKMVGAYCNTPSSQTNTFAFSPNWLNIILISISYLLALLCKETAVGLLPVVLMFLFLKTDKLESNFLKRRLLLFIPFVITTSFYMLLRSYVINKDVGLRVFTGIQSQPELTSNDLTSSNISIIEAIGFYIKKLFLPLPLNFIIVDINRSLYFWLGLMIIAVVLYILYKRNLYSFIVMLMISFIAPALMILMRNMTWTFVSERYLYISSFGAVLLIVVLFYRITASMSENLRLSLLFCLIIASCFITVNRVYIWQSNVTLFEDVIKKSPNSGYAANEYGIALAQNKQYLEALNQFKIARSLSRKSYKIPIFNQISTELQETGDLQKAKNSYIDQLKDPQTYRYPLLLKIVEITDQQLLHIKNDQKVRDIIIEQIFYLNQAAKLKKTGYTYYKLGQLYLNISDNINARENFEKSIELEPNGYCAASAKKLIKSLQ